MYMHMRPSRTIIIRMNSFDFLRRELYGFPCSMGLNSVSMYADGVPSNYLLYVASEATIIIPNFTHCTNLKTVYKHELAFEFLGHMYRA
jgi:hypothetical protein